jgi:hypothetical protein
VATQGPHVLALERTLLHSDARLSALLQAGLRLRIWEDIGDGAVHFQGKENLCLGAQRPYSVVYFGIISMSFDETWREEIT